MIEIKNQKASWFLILTILIAIAIVLLALIIPSFFRSKPGGGPSAEGILKLLVFDEAAWKREDGDRNGQQDYWTKDVAGFYYAKNASGYRLHYIDLRVANSDPSVTNWDKDAKVAPSNDYYFKAIPLDENGKPYNQNVVSTNLGADAYVGQACCNSTKFAFCAYPSKYNVTGVHTFIVNECGIIYMKDFGKSEPIEKWPSEDPTKEGWTVVD